MGIVVLDRNEKRKRNRRVSFSGGKNELLVATKAVFTDVLSALFFINEYVVVAPAMERKLLESSTTMWGILRDYIGN